MNRLPNTPSTSAALEQGLGRMVRRIIPGAGGIAGLRPLSGGASQETWSFDATTPDGAIPLVLRRHGPGAEERAQFSAGLDVEAALIREAARHGVAVPNIRHVLQAEDGIGTGFIMDRLCGETIARKILRDPEFDAVRPRLARQCGRQLALIHRIEGRHVPGLKRIATEDELDGYFASYLRIGRKRPVFELAFRWLRDHLPGQGAAMTVVHGDFRNGNLMIGAGGLRAVLDWELAHIGDPMKDLGWICTNSWRFGQIDHPVGGFGMREDLFAAYQEAGGMPVEPGRVRFWEVFGSLKWGLMCEDMVATFQSGADTSVERAAIGRRVSETEIDLLALLAPRPARAGRA